MLVVAQHGDEPVVVGDRAGVEQVAALVGAGPAADSSLCWWLPVRSVVIDRSDGDQYGHALVELTALHGNVAAADGEHGDWQELVGSIR
jgi:hypothetical protein